MESKAVMEIVSSIMAAYGYPRSRSLINNTEFLTYYHRLSPTRNLDIYVKQGHDTLYWEVESKHTCEVLGKRQRAFKNATDIADFIDTSVLPNIKELVK